MKLDPTRNRLLLFPRPDPKFHLWSREIHDLSGQHQLVPTWRPWFGFIHFIRYRLKGYAIDAYVVRYLNDPGSTRGALTRLIGEGLTLLFARILDIPVFWIIHNIDRETCNLRPRLIQLRRSLVRRSATAYFVTEESLIEPARRLHGLEGDIGITPLGVPDAETLSPSKPGRSWNRFKARAEQWLAESGTGQAPCLLVVGTPDNKYTHFWRLGELLDSANAQGIPLRALVIAPLDTAYGQQLKGALSEHEARASVLFSEFFVDMDWRWAADHCLALLRGYSDLSMSHAIYHAVTVGMPILAIPGGVVPDIVQSEGIGTVLDERFEDLGPSLQGLSPLDHATRQRFMSKRSAARAVASLLQATRGNTAPHD